MIEPMVEGRRIVCTREWLDHELGRVLNRFDMVIEEDQSYGILIEPEDPGYVRVIWFRRPSEEEARNHGLRSLLRFWDWVKGGAR